MDKILIAIDNKTPGAIVTQIVAFIRPISMCRLKKGCHRDIYSLSSVNKYFNGIIGNNPCTIKTFFNHRVCKTHSSNFAELETIHETVTKAQRSRATYVHFTSKELADKAYPLVGRGNRCCYGKGFQL